MGSTYGYIRVSSIDQNEDRQTAAMQEAGVAGSDIYMDKQSGKDFNRLLDRKCTGWQFSVLRLKFLYRNRGTADNDRKRILR